MNFSVSLFYLQIFIAQDGNITFVFFFMHLWMPLLRRETKDILCYRQNLLENIMVL